MGVGRIIGEVEQIIGGFNPPNQPVDASTYDRTAGFERPEVNMLLDYQPVKLSQIATKITKVTRLTIRRLISNTLFL